MRYMGWLWESRDYRSLADDGNEDKDIELKNTVHCFFGCGAMKQIGARLIEGFSRLKPERSRSKDSRKAPKYQEMGLLSFEIFLDILRTRGYGYASRTLYMDFTKSPLYENRSPYCSVATC